jgi:predicted DsbA family dithiol-disulfide isomerase
MTKIDIVSDPICPWCYIGKSRLERALESRPAHDVVIAWHPFQLNPDMPPQGMDRREYLEAKFGGREGALKTYGQIANMAQADGLDIDFAAIKRTPNTLDAHRLIHWAGLEGVQNAIVERLFKAYFRQGLDISDPQVLADIAGAAGLDAAMITMLLQSDGDRDDIRARDRDARARGIQGVPCFIIDDHYVVNGAQPTEMWQKVIDEITAKATGQTP